MKTDKRKRKLSDKDVKEIKIRLVNGDKLRDIADDYDCDFTMVHHIKSGRRRSDVKI